MKQAKKRKLWADLAKGAAVAAVMALPIAGMAAHGVDTHADTHSSGARP